MSYLSVKRTGGEEGGYFMMDLFTYMKFKMSTFTYTFGVFKTIHN